MPNLASVLKDEIRRLARKEARAQISSLKSASAQQRREIASLKRRAKEQDREIARVQKQLAKPQSASTAAENGTTVRFSPDWVAKHRETLTEKLRANPYWYDAERAGWWLWAQSATIGINWETAGYGRPNLASKGIGMHASGRTISATLDAYAQRLRYVRLCCGDWERVCGPTILTNWLTCGVFLDPPYSQALRCPTLYASDHASHNQDVAPRMAAWAREHGDNPAMRIVLCGYEGEHGEWPPGWREMKWTAHGGYSHGAKNGDNTNRTKERLWIFPHCEERQLDLFD